MDSSALCARVALYRDSRTQASCAKPPACKPSLRHGQQPSRAKQRDHDKQKRMLRPSESILPCFIQTPGFVPGERSSLRTCHTHGLHLVHASPDESKLILANDRGLNASLDRVSPVKTFS
jgi:hypothetical protein